MNFSNTKLQKCPAVPLPYFPAPPANERPDEFIPANTKYPYIPGVSPIRQRMSGVKDSGQLTSCWISQASSPGIRRSRALNMGSVEKHTQQTHNAFIEKTARAWPHTCVSWQTQLVLSSDSEIYLRFAACKQNQILIKLCTIIIKTNKAFVNPGKSFR